MMRHHRPSGMKWIWAAVSPWALGAGLLVSFTAVAGNDMPSGKSTLEAARPGPLVPALAGAPLVPANILADLDLDGILKGRNTAPAAEPRTDLKLGAHGFPDVQRHGKSAPLGEVGTSLSRRGAELRREAGLGRVIFAHLPDGEAAMGLVPGPAMPGEADLEARLEPFLPDDPTMTRLTTAPLSPAAAAAGSTGSGRSASGPRGGATPTVRRAISLASATPAEADATPIEIAAAPVAAPAPGLSGKLIGATVDGRARYADLVTPETLAREQRCLAEAVYFEARSEPLEGQAAVAQVVLNRAKSGLYPDSICGVVYQNRHRHLACQFTFACEGKALRIGESAAWAQAKEVAESVLNGTTYLADVGGATHYHANYVKPYWARRLTRMDRIGRHIFYKLKPGQT